MRSTLACLALILLAGTTLPQAANSPPRKIGNFHLKNTAGISWALDDLKGKKAIVVVFLGTQCPVNNAYVPRLAELHKEYADKGVQFLAVNANEHETPQSIAEHAKKFAIPFPVLRDEKHLAADRFGAERTPEAFLLDGDFVVR